MTARAERIDAPTQMPDATRIDELVNGLGLWRVVPSDPADLVNSPSARRMAARASKSSGRADVPPLSISALGIDPLDCPRIRRGSDLVSRKPNAGMPRPSPKLSDPREIVTTDPQLMQVVEVWPELPPRTRNAIVAAVRGSR